MGQKVNPKGFRIGVIRDWDSRWYANNKDFKNYLYEDYQVRKYVKEKLYSSGVSKVDIERTGGRVKINVFTAKPGIVIGRGGQEVEVLRQELEKMTGKKVSVNITEIKRQDLRDSMGMVLRRGQGPPAHSARRHRLRFCRSQHRLRQDWC